MSAVNVTTESAIARPIEQVASFAADPDNVPAWYVNIESIEWKTSRPVMVGSQIAFVAHFPGRRPALMKSSSLFPASGSSCGRVKDRFRWKQPMSGR